MNLLEIKTRVKRTFGDESGAQITDADITRWANDAQVDIARKTEALQGSDTASSVQGQEAYSLPADFLYLRRVTFDGLHLRSLTLEEVDNFASNRDEGAPQETPRHYWVWNLQLHLYPRPTANGTDNIAFQYVKMPAALSGDSDISEFPVQMHEDIVRYCLMRAYELNEDFRQAREVEQDYESRVAQAKYETYWPHADSYPAVRLEVGDDEYGYYNA